MKLKKYITSYLVAVATLTSVSYADIGPEPDYGTNTPLRTSTPI